MRRALVLLVFLFASGSYAQHRSTRLLLPARDFASYARFLHTFGFATTDSTHDIVRMSDGQLLLALMHIEDLQGPQLAMFVDDIDHIDTLLAMQSGVNVFRDENGAINEIDVKAPGGVMLFIHPSVQGSLQKPAMTANLACGALVEFSVAVTDLDAAAAFWKLFGFEQTYAGASPHPMRRVSDGTFVIGLHQDANTERGLTYASKTAESQIAGIRSHGVEPILSSDGKNGGGVMASFQAPEGLIVTILGLTK
jgi:hypothetical protein